MHGAIGQSSACLNFDIVDKNRKFQAGSGAGDRERSAASEQGDIRQRMQRSHAVGITLFQKPLQSDFFRHVPAGIEKCAFGRCFSESVSPVAEIDFQKGSVHYLVFMDHLDDFLLVGCQLQTQPDPGIGKCFTVKIEKQSDILRQGIGDRIKMTRESRLAFVVPRDEAHAVQVHDVR